MELVVGVDVGNSTTEACLARSGTARWRLLATALTRTTGVKGTPDNADGAVTAVRAALERRRASRRTRSHRVLLNEATPVISGLAMETITETIITESTMIGHNPATPGGTGLGVGITVAIGDVLDGPEEARSSWSCRRAWDFDDVAATLNAAVEQGRRPTAAILARRRRGAGRQPADARRSRWSTRSPRSTRCRWACSSAVEVAAPGRTIRTLSNSYGLASMFGLDAEQTRQVVARGARAHRATGRRWSCAPRPAT